MERRWPRPPRGPLPSTPALPPTVLVLVLVCRAGGDSTREALLGAASAPRPRRRIHSPALVPKAEAPRLLRYVCCSRDTPRLELGGPCQAPWGSPPHPEPAVSPTCAPGSPEALCLAGPLCPGLWMVVGERSLSPTKYHDQKCRRKAPRSSTAPTHPEFFAAQPTLFYFFFFFLSHSGSSHPGSWPLFHHLGSWE